MKGGGRRELGREGVRREEGRGRKGGRRRTEEESYKIN